VDVLASADVIIVAGRIVGGLYRSHAEHERRIRQLLRDIGHRGSDFVIVADAVVIRLLFTGATEDYARGACGEPGPDEPAWVCRYATDETPELMPLPTLLAHRLSARAAQLRRSGDLPWLLPHARTKVSVRYAAGRPVAVDRVEITVQHLPKIDYTSLCEYVFERIFLPVVPEALFADDTRVAVNPTGSRIEDGLLTGCCVSGRNLASDTYGPHCPMPFAGFAGRGSEDIRHLGTLMSRRLAKHVVAAGLARRCTVNLRYAEAQPEPEAVLVDTHGTGAVPEARIERVIQAVFPLTPLGMFMQLELGRPLYRETAAFGYFGRPGAELPWERVDQSFALRNAV
jgi:S-adenosylmethionine synthetase